MASGSVEFRVTLRVSVPTQDVDSKFGPAADSVVGDDSVTIARPDGSRHNESLVAGSRPCPSPFDVADPSNADTRPPFAVRPRHTELHQSPPPSRETQLNGWKRHSGIYGDRSQSTMPMSPHRPCPCLRSTQEPASWVNVLRTGSLGFQSPR